MKKNGHTSLGFLDRLGGGSGGVPFSEHSNDLLPLYSPLQYGLRKFEKSKLKNL